MNEITAYYKSNYGNLVTAIYLEAEWVEELSSGFGQTGFGLTGFGE
jgi:hypothetical protein